MKVIKPIRMSPEKLLSSSAQEVYTQWDSTTTYDVGDKVLYEQSIYESIIASNLNLIPTANPEQWLRVAPSNTYAMFDNSISTQTSGTTPLTVSVKPSVVFNSLALLNMDATSVTIEVLESDELGAPVVYSETISLLNTETIIDWYTYFFENIEYRKDVVVFNIPPYSTGVINITLESGGSDVAIGSMIFGSVYDIGSTQFGVGLGIRDYSVKQTDTFGNTIFVERNFSKRMTPQVIVQNSQINFVSRVLTDLRATPTVYVACDDPKFEPLIVYGYMRDWIIEIPYPDYSYLSLDIEGLT